MTSPPRLLCSALLSLWAYSCPPAIASALGQPGGAASFLGPDTRICLRSTIQRQLATAESRCDPKAIPGADGADGGVTINGSLPIDEVWRGPHACAGVFCVFSNPTFNDNRGMVVISTARGAEAIANALLGANKGRKPAPYHGADSSSMFKPKNIPGKGLGLVATRPIGRGQAIMSQPLAIVVDRNFIDIHEDDRLRLLAVAIDQMSDATLREFLDQAVQSSDNDVGRVMDILNTNSFNMRVGGQAHVGNYLDVSRLNHDCRPNLAFHISLELSHHTVAARDIQAGEELTISYLDAFKVRSVRRERAINNWGFACTCSQCTLPQPLAKASDGRLWRIYQLESQLQRWPSMSGSGDGSDPAEAPPEPDTIEALLSLYQQERLDFAMADAYTLAALNYNAFGRAELAMKYASLALEAGTIENGELGSDVRAMGSLLENPRGHWSWRRRVIGMD